MAHLLKNAGQLRLAFISRPIVSVFLLTQCFDSCYSKLQAREAFATYLECVQVRLLKETRFVASDREVLLKQLTVYVV